MTATHEVPVEAEALFHEAVEHHKGGRPEAAERAYRRVLSEFPKLAPALGNLGDLLHSLGRKTEAFELYERAAAAAPADANVRNSWGASLLRDGRVDEAETQFRAMLATNPDEVRALNNLGEILFRRGDLEEAHRCLGRAVQINPDSWAAHATFGRLLLHGGRVGDAMKLLERARVLAPGRPEVHVALADALWAAGRIDDSLKSSAEALHLRPGLFTAWTSRLFVMHAGDGREPAELFADHVRLGRMLERRFASERAQRTAQGPADRRLRIGYVSQDLRRHPVGLFLLPVVKSHDRVQVEVFAYSLSKFDDDVQTQLRTAVDHWVDASTLTEKALVRRIQDDCIDMLVDLAGPTSATAFEVFARRAAPVQVSWLGYPDTTGLATMDYRVTDAVADPPGESDALHTETLLRLPGGFLAWRSAIEPVPAAPPSVKNGFVTFGSFNNASKISRACVRTWSAILREVPGSRMILKHLAFAQPESVAHVRAWFEADGVAADRLEFRHMTKDWREGFQSQADTDIALDAYPYNGATTTCETLAVGVPVVALRGRHHAGRVSASLLTALGEASLVAESEADYVRIATSLARDPERLAQLRGSLAQRWAASTVGSPERLAQELETAYREAFRRTLDGAPRKELPDVGPRELRDDELELADCGGVRLAVPPSLESLTTYTLREQGDWSDSELRFVRILATPGFRALDIGAGYGVYALSVAARAGNDGRVWAVEPEPRTAAFLRAGVARNGFGNVTVVEAAVTSRTGETKLHVGGATERASLIRNGLVHDHTELVAGSTLDALRDVHGVRDVEFLRIDAPGEELSILAGAKGFLHDESPLVMVALRAGDDTGPLRAAFATHGYECYRFVPALGVLTLAHHTFAFDELATNVFFCRPARAAQLADRGLVATPSRVQPSPHAPGRWQNDIAQFQYGVQLMPFWQSQHPRRDLLETALDRWFDAHDPAVPLGARVQSLEIALELLSNSLDAHPSLSRLVTVARVAAALGIRVTAVGALQTAFEWFTNGAALELDEPFLVPSPRFDGISIDKNEVTYCFGAVLDELEHLRAASGYTLERSSRDLHTALVDVGFMTPSMERRKKLLDERFDPGT